MKTYRRRLQGLIVSSVWIFHASNVQITSGRRRVRKRGLEGRAELDDTPTRWRKHAASKKTGLHSMIERQTDSCSLFEQRAHEVHECFGFATEGLEQMRKKYNVIPI